MILDRWIGRKCGGHKVEPYSKPVLASQVSPSSTLSNRARMTRTQTQSQSKAAPDFLRVPLPTGLLQRKCACGQHTIAGGECESCGKKKEATKLQRAPRNSELGTRNSGGVPPIVHDVLGTPGQQLDANTRSFFEPRFGHDFTRVSAHGAATQPTQ